MRMSSQLKALGTMLIVMVVLALLPGFTVQADFGTNWTGQFFNTTDLTGSIVAISNYPSGINFTWPGKPTDGSGVELAAVNADNFSVRFTSVQTFQQGTYQFSVFMDDGARMFIDGVLVQDNFNPPAAGTTQTFSRDMTAGQHTLVVEFVEIGGAAVIQVQWFLGGATTTLTPGAPTGTPVPVTTGSVVQVRGLSVRTGPYLGASLIAIARPGTAYPVSARNMDEGIFTWYLITVGDQTGWASGRYLEITGDVNAIPIRASIFDQIDGEPFHGVTALPRAIMNFRRRPSTRVNILGKIPWGAEVELIGRTVQGGINRWFQVRYNGVVGWIFAPYVTVHGPLDAVPIR